MSDQSNRKSGMVRHDIFVSYARDDSEVANSLVELCRQKGASINIWQDKDKIQPGIDWSEKINKDISSSRLVIVLLSNNAKSENLRQSEEWTAICENRWSRPDVRVFPIVLDESEPPAFLRDLQTLDGSDKEKLASCVRRITDKLKLGPESERENADIQTLDDKHKKIKERIEELERLKKEYRDRFERFEDLENQAKTLNKRKLKIDTSSSVLNKESKS